MGAVLSAVGSGGAPSVDATTGGTSARAGGEESPRASLHSGWGVAHGARGRVLPGAPRRTGGRAGACRVLGAALRPGRGPPEGSDGGRHGAPPDRATAPRCGDEVPDAGRGS